MAPQEEPQDDPKAGAVDALADSAGGVPDELFDRVESAAAGSKNGIY